MKTLKSVLAKNKLLVLILLAAAILRFAGVKPGYNPYHPDEPVLTGVPMQMIRKETLDPGRYDYPALTIYINYIFFKTFFIPLSWAKYYLIHIPDIFDGVVSLSPSTLELKRLFQVEIVGVRDINALFWGRYVAASFSLGCVYLVYVLAKKLFNNQIGLIAALFLAFNFKHVANSHINLPDPYNCFFLLLSLIATVNLWYKPSKRKYIIAGIAAGVSMSVKYQFYGLMPFGLVHLYNSLDGLKLNFKKLFSSTFIASALLVPLVFMILGAYSTINIEVTMGWMDYIYRRYQTGADLLRIFPMSYLYHIDYGPAMTVFILLGMALATLKFFKKSLVLIFALIPACFILFYYTGGGLFVRNFLTITPIFLTFAAILVWQLYLFLRKRSSKLIASIVLIALLVICLYVPAKNSLINAYYYTKPWNHEVLKAWERENLPDDIKIAAIPFDPVEGPSNVERTMFEVYDNYSLSEHREAGAQWALVNTSWATNPFYMWMGLGPEDFDLVWKKPLDQMRNTFDGLAIEELFRYQVFSVTKPWQSPEFNYVLAKLPQWPITPMQQVELYNFDDGLQGWSSGYDQNEGHTLPGSISVELKGAIFPAQRVVSQPIEVKPGHLYKVSGFLRTSENLPSELRDGFLRIDFYREQTPPKYDGSDNPEDAVVGDVNSVSSRVWGSGDWVERDVIERAPDDAKIMTVSLQIGSRELKLWADDVKVEESTDVIQDPIANPPYNRKTIDPDLLYYNSIGNL